MATCTRCQVSDWHPCARACTVPDCEIAAARVQRLQQPASDRQPQHLVGGGERGGIHAPSYRARELAAS